MLLRQIYVCFFPPVVARVFVLAPNFSPTPSSFSSSIPQEPKPSWTHFLLTRSFSLSPRLSISALSIHSQRLGGFCCRSSVEEEVVKWDGQTYVRLCYPNLYHLPWKKVAECKGEGYRDWLRVSYHSCFLFLFCWVGGSTVTLIYR